MGALSHIKTLRLQYTLSVSIFAAHRAYGWLRIIRPHYYDYLSIYLSIYLSVYLCRSLLLYCLYCYVIISLGKDICCFLIDVFCIDLQVLYHEDGSVKGIATNDVGIRKDGAPKVGCIQTWSVYKSKGIKTIVSIYLWQHSLTNNIINDCLKYFYPS